MDLVDVFLRVIEHHRISQREVSRLIGFRSDNQMTRILQHKVSQQKMLEFGQQLLSHKVALKLTADEEAAIECCLMHMSDGQENVYALEHFIPLLCSQTAVPPPEQFLYVIDESGQPLGTLRELVSHAQKLEAIVINCANSAVISAFAQCAQETSVSVNYYYLAESSVMHTVSVLEMTWPYLFCDWFHPFSVHLKESRLATGLWSADVIFLRITPDTQQTSSMLSSSWRMLVLQSKSTAVLTGLSCSPELLHRNDVTLYSLYNDAAQEDYVKYLQYIEELEHQHRIFRIKPDLGFELIPINIQIAALEGTSFQQEYAPLIASVTEIARQRYLESIKKASRQYHIVTKEAMVHFAQTGILTDHFWGFRPYTKEERLQILQEIYGRMLNSPFFRLRILCDGIVLKPREVIGYENYGVCILMEKSAYHIEAHRELMLHDRLFSDWFNNFFRDYFCSKYTYNSNDSAAIIKDLICMLL